MNNGHFSCMMFCPRFEFDEKPIFSLQIAQAAVCKMRCHVRWENLQRQEKKKKRCSISVELIITTKGQLSLE